MMKYFSILIVPILCAFATSAEAGRVVELKKELQANCPARQWGRRELIPLVRKAYLTCIPGQLIEAVEGCRIPCLKGNAGNIIGYRYTDRVDRSASSPGAGKVAN